MKIIIRGLNEQNIQGVNHCDGTFSIDAQLILRAEDNIICYDVVPVQSHQKRYPFERIDYTTYLTDPDKTIFFAYADGQLAGQVIVRKNWNQFAYIEDIVVDIRFRRNGVGHALMNKTITWAKSKRLAGIMLETQNNNVAACRFYEKCGFELGGFDKCLYKGISKDTDELALYWYLFF